MTKRDMSDPVRCRIVVVGITPRIRGAYREFRSVFDATTAHHMAVGAALITGEGRVAYQLLPDGAEPDDKGRAAGLHTVGDLLRAENADG